MATGCSLPRPVVHEPLGCCLAASHLTAPLINRSVASSTTTLSLGTSAPAAGGASAGAARKIGLEQGVRADRTDRAATKNFCLIRMVLVVYRGGWGVLSGFAVQTSRSAPSKRFSAREIRSGG